jgi:hypothetical protein
MAKNANVEECETTGMEMDAKLENKDQLNSNEKKRTTPVPSRRAGFDRRWIPSENHHPERRRGGDRRAARQRSFSDPLVPDAPGENNPATAGFEAISQPLAWEPESAMAGPEANRPPEFHEDRNKKLLPGSGSVPGLATS